MAELQARYESEGRGTSQIKLLQRDAELRNRSTLNLKKVRTQPHAGDAPPRWVKSSLFAGGHRRR